MEPAHPLDRPVWAALTTRQAKLAEGDGRALRIAPAFGPFAAAADNSRESQVALAALVQPEGGLVIVETEEVPPPPGTEIAMRAVGHQMVAEQIVPGGVTAFAIEQLTEADAPDMLALATLTKPGPFAARTHQLGDFFGVKQDGRLVAMAGERMKPDGFTEISGVCTHPEHRGRGYAAALIRVVAARIFARGEVPFLHVYASNTGAIALYESLGFRLRRPLMMTVLNRREPTR